MLERRPVLFVLVGLTLCISFWRISMQEPQITTEYATFESNTDELQSSSNDGVDNTITFNDKINTTLPTSSPTLMPTTIDLKEDLKNLIDLHNFEYIINHDACDEPVSMQENSISQQPEQFFDTSYSAFEEQQQPFAVILIHSAPGNWHKRNVIRDTWGQKDPRAHLYFLLGTIKSVSQQKRIQQESKMFQDIIQGNFLDAYRNMTYKHIMALKWFVYNCQKLKYLIKTDDDVFVNTPALFSFLENFADKQNFLFCFKSEGSRIKRSYRSKWRVSTKEYRGWYYPPYCPGFSIVYSADVVHQLYQKAQRTKYFWIDDVHVTGTLAQYLNISITTWGKYYLNGLQRDNLFNGYTNLTSLQPMFLFTEPNLVEQQIRKIWKLVLSNNSR